MAIASAVAIVSMSYLAIDAGVVNTSAVTKPIKVAQASLTNLTDAAYGQVHLAFAVQAWARGNDWKVRPVTNQSCIHGHERGPQTVSVDRGV